MKAAHRVQSIRGIIERGFAALKKWFILFGGNSTSIKTKEMELDLAAALENLWKRFKANLVEGIPARAPHPMDAHIITKPTDAQLKIPRQIDFKSDHFPRHLLDSYDFLRAVVPQHLGCGWRCCLLKQNHGARQKPACWRPRSAVTCAKRRYVRLVDLCVSWCFNAPHHVQLLLA